MKAMTYNNGDELKKKPEDTIAGILQFQKILIGKQDVTCHTIAEATEQNE